MSLGTRTGASCRRAGTLEAGFGIVECLVAALLLLVGVLSTLTLLQVGSAKTVTTQNREAALSVSRDVIEAARRAAYDRLVSGTAEAELKNVSGIGSGTPWTVTRRGTSFTVAATSCAVDDPADGQGSHGSGYCPESPGPGTADKTAEDLRRIAVTVSWTEAGTTRHVRQGTIVRNPGDAEGPWVTNLTKTGNSPALLTATASAGTTKVVLYANGTEIGLATANGSSWTLSWNPPQAGMQYYVDARAYDAQGRSRPEVARVLVVRT